MWHNQGHKAASIVYAQKEKKVPRSCKIATFFSHNRSDSGYQNWGFANIIQLGDVYRKDYLAVLDQSEFYKQLRCPDCGAPASMARHGAYARYLLTFEVGELSWIRTIVVRVICSSCGNTHALLPADLVAYCQYSLDVLVFIYSQVLLQGASVPRVARDSGLPVWSVYLVMRRYEQFLAQIGLLLFELDYQPSDYQRFGRRECLERIQQYGLNRLAHRYFQYNRRYLWQTRLHNRASPPAGPGWFQLGGSAFT